VAQDNPQVSVEGLLEKEFLGVIAASEVEWDKGNNTCLKKKEYQHDKG
jgi:hypothetical protein